VYIQNIFVAVDQIGWYGLNITTDSYVHTVSNGHFSNGNRKCPTGCARCSNKFLTHIPTSNKTPILQVNATYLSSLTETVYVSLQSMPL
jgi:hypothetical protein